MFNSNSPEVVVTEGILLSTFPPSYGRVARAHLDQLLSGEFELFAHHIARERTPGDLTSLYIGILLHNPGRQPVTVDVLNAASYLSQPDAPFVDLPALVEDPTGSVYAGPGSRVTSDFVRRQFPQQRDAQIWPTRLVLAPGESQMLMNLPIPIRELTPPLNGRSTLIRVRSNGPVYAASLGLYARQDADGSEQAPTLQEWETLLREGDIAGPRDRPPTPIVEKPTGPVIYSRVAGVARGVRWQAYITDSDTQRSLTIPAAGQALSYVLNTVYRNTFGTGQVQSAPLLRRYEDTAYQAHGNYSIHYDLTLPLRNPTAQPQTVTLAIQTPLKLPNDQAQGSLSFLEPPGRQVMFRGTIRLRYRDDQGLPVNRFVHLVQRQGQQGEPLVTLQLPPGSERLVQVDYFYPPDATPHQVLTLRTL
ncbi:DUF3370 domain-containing protein [Leptolyngbya sp. FACHB-261]|nr:DUF3370 domain-containing protein [Leptolyngbya sp. FACHB-261]